MPYAVLQTDLNPPRIEQMARAFRNVPGLTPADAHILGNDAFGILVKDFSEQQAGAMQGALRIEGIETEVVDQSFLPPLPTMKFVHRLDCSPERLLLYDPVGRSFALDWRHIIFIAAGAVRMSEFVQQRQQRPTLVHTGRFRAPEAEYDIVSREERNFRLIGEIIITGTALRYSFSAEKFNFAYLGERNTKDPAANFVSLVRDLAQFSANARLNRGATTLRGDAAQLFSYPSKNAFYEEIIWTLWQMKKAA